MIDLSVIVPIYNIEKYLRRCIESIIAQSCHSMEIILVDDGSLDSCGNICDEFAQADSRIIAIHKENGGLVSARKEGLRRAQGKYVIYVDGDDWIEADACEKMLKSIDSKKADMVFYDHFENTGDFEKLVKHGIKEGIYDKKLLEECIYPHMISGDSFFEWQVIPTLWDVILKRDLLEKHQFDVEDEIALGEDAACIYPCLLDAKSVAFERKAYYHYRQTANSMIKQRPGLEIERKRLNLLNTYVGKKLNNYPNEYGLKKQWLSYMLFLTLPRADQLYRDYSKLTFLYPYFEVKPTMKIAIYGAGTYGQRLYSYIRQTGFCEVIAWFDRNYEELKEQGFDVKSPEDINKYQYDGIIIANLFYESRQQIRKTIKEKTDTKIFEIDTEFIFSKESLSGFGL
ncbi:MAG: glycosyltransferase [Lachnospiraceae bacterium]|nr:glycosyltransferase [Lachnospiraceae bacterium]